jgi:hypothetical protein
VRVLYLVYVFCMGFACRRSGVQFVVVVLKRIQNRMFAAVFEFFRKISRIFLSVRAR